MSEQGKIEQPHIPDAPEHLRALLYRLPRETGGFLVTQHYHDPHPGEWFAGWNAGEIGPYASAEEALIAGIKWLYGLYKQADAERDEPDDEGLAPWRAALE